MNKKAMFCGILVFHALVFNFSVFSEGSPDTETSQNQPVSTIKEEPEEKEVMEIGGLVTVDASADLSDIKNTVAEIGAVELSANVNVAEGVVASITLLAESNLSELSIDQALVEIAPENKPFSLIFGQQSYNFGFISTRLISDPSLVDAVETSGPGLAVNLSAGILSPGLAVTYSHNPTETEKVYTINFSDSTVQENEITIAEETNYFKGIVNLDLSILEESTIRIASRFDKSHLGLNAASEIILSKAAIDAEFYSELLDDIDPLAGGWYFGLAYDFSDNFNAGIRYDGYSEDSFTAICHGIGAGATISFKHGIFCALEYHLDDISSGEVVQELALQVGLESTIKLPGFQRKTLTRN
jgi:hypothetical protein